MPCDILCFLRVKNVVAEIKLFFGQPLNDLVYYLPFCNKPRK